MVVTIFRSRLRSEAIPEYEEMAARMYELASQIPGFVARKTFSAADGERVSIVEFETVEAHQAWREHPEHRKAQQLGRERFYAEYTIQVCETPRAYQFKQK